MDKRNIRIGDWICDASNHDCELRAGMDELQYANIFVPIPLSRRFLKTFKPEEVSGRVFYYREEKNDSVVLEDMGGKWRLSIRTNDKVFEGIIKSVSQLQHLLSDCGIHWDICG